MVSDMEVAMRPLRPWQACSRLALSALAAIAAFAAPGIARASVASAVLHPTPLATNQVPITVQLGNTPVGATSQVLDPSTLYLSYDTSSHQLTVLGADLLGTDVTFDFGALLEFTTTNLLVVVNTDFPGAPTPVVSVNPSTGAFSNLNVPVEFTGTLTFPGQPDTLAAAATATIVLSGTFTYDAGSGSMSFAGVTGTFGPVKLVITPLVFVFVSGTPTFNFSGPTLLPVFADGFESGGLSAWSETSP